MMAPMSIALSSGSPTRSLLIRVRTLSRKGRSIDSCTSSREPGAAHLALVEPDRVDQPLDGAVEVGVVEDDERRLAAELERQAFARACRRLANDAADLGRTGERDLVDARVIDDRGASLTVAGDHVEHARRQADRLADLGKQQRRQRRELGRASGRPCCPSPAPAQPSRPASAMESSRG